MENEKMELEVIEMEMEPETEEKGISTGLAMAIGALLTAGGIAGVKGVKKLLAKRKANKDLEVEDGFEDDFEEKVVEFKKTEKSK